MDSSTRIDQLTSLAFGPRIQKQNAQDDGGNDLFARALDQQLAKQHDASQARSATARTRPTSESRTDRKADASVERRADKSAGDDAPGDDGARNSDVSRETNGTQAAPESAPARTEQPQARKAAKPADANTKPNTVATKAAAPQPDGTAAERAPAATGEAADVAGAGTQAKQPATPATTATQPGATVIAAAPDTPAVAAQVAPVTPPVAADAAKDAIGVLMLTGAPNATPNGLPQDAALPDPALAALLAKLPNARAAARATATDGAAPGNDPDSIAPADPLLSGKAKPAALDSDATDGQAKAGTSAQTGNPQQTAAKSPTAQAQTDTSKSTAAAPTPFAALASATTGATRNITVPEDMTLTGDSSVGDLEFSAWSDQLGPMMPDGTLARSANMRSAAFLAELKQNIQTVPAHEQVAVQIQRGAQNGLGRLTVDLQPAELGRVEIKMNVDKDKNVTASVVVDRPATLDLLQRDARTLERLLQDAGLQTNSGSLSFSLRDSGPGDHGQSGGGTASQGGGKAGADDAVKATVRPDVVATADGYVDLKT